MSTIALSPNAAGTAQFTIAAPGTSTNRTLTLPDTTGTVATLGTSLTLATAQASTSGTAIDFTGIPSWAKRITVMFSGVSTNGTSLKVLRLGTSGGIAATGYQSGVFVSPAANQYANSTTDFVLSYVTNSIAAGAMHGAFVLTNVTGNTWVLHGSYYETGFGAGGAAGGSITLAATLDRLRITTANGTDTFDAGTINVMYEG